jgi:raffinose/stachyose/melibiose transport system permease protein
METQLTAAPETKRARRKSSNRSLAVKNRMTWVLFLLPALAIYVLFMAVPLLSSIRLSLFTGEGIVPKTFVGLTNFETLLKNPIWSGRLSNALKNTFILFLIHMSVQNTLGLLFAVLLTNKIRAFNFFRTVIFLPATLSVLVIGFLWKLILNPQWGAVPLILTKVGLASWVQPWLGDPRYALIVISLVSCWQWVGLPTMMYLAALFGIPEELVEASKVDGASAWQSFWHIKYPLLAPIIGIVSVLTFIGNFRAFDIVYAMASARGDPAGSTDIMGSMFYRTGIGGEVLSGHMDAGMGAAIAVVIFIVLLVGVVAWLYFSRKQEYEL